MNNTEYILGMDPGKSGALCFLPLDGSALIYLATPTIKGTREIDLCKIYRFVHPLMACTRVCVIEDVHSIFGTSSKSNFQFGRSLGNIEMLPVVFGKPLIKVAPKTWQRVAWQGIPVVKNPKVVKASKNKDGTLKPERTLMKTDTKATSLNAARRLFPKESFLDSPQSSVAHDGVVDAALIAYWAKRENI